MNVYINEHGAELRKKDGRLFIVLHGELLHSVPLGNLDTICLFGNVSITTPLIKYLLRRGIELAYFSQNGKLLGQLTSPNTKDVFLRKMQAKLSENPEFVMRYSIDLVKNKVLNQIYALKKYRRSHDALDKIIDELEGRLSDIQHCKDLEELLGQEGYSTRLYFEGFAKILKHRFDFEGRNKFPPRDPVNALLSFGYVVFGNEIASLLDGAGFDPYIGIMHRDNYGRDSLANDIIEPFRAPVVDLFVLKLVNLRIIRDEHFKKGKACFLNTEGRREFFRHYEKWIEEENDFRKAIREATNRLEKNIDAGESEMIWRAE